MTAHTVLSVSGLDKQYNTFHLSDVSFSVPGGTMVGLIGENGAGKSTTIKSILGLVRPDGGSITLLDRPSDAPDALDDIGYVPDECPFPDLFRPLQVDKILSGVYRSWDSALFRSYLQKFHLPEKAPIKTFSRGMKMKLSIAAALSHHPRLLLLDEATSGLDPVVREEILDEFLAFLSDEDHGVLLSTHITSDLERAADYVVYLHSGKVMLNGEKDEILDRYGKLVCSAADLEQVEPSFLNGVRRGQFSCEALVNDRPEFQRRYPHLLVDRVTLEDIMVFMGKENRQ
ncbi:MAG TPA: ABC transporter ATP-binding protein [Candidatus Flavonifractor merdipullorum]|uniref:ABC transporter ATP-binding protein n=1 Tax=Candidatus Flavonifractor merdipullorum TaxID=2838590 RepID=A0A9D1RUS2_9FIRM|nr:ABC transporter ATP-binding protein [Candidatus Flavonifractor merdipullorum]